MCVLEKIFEYWTASLELAHVHREQESVHARLEPVHDALLLLVPQRRRGDVRRVAQVRQVRAHGVRPQVGHQVRRQSVQLVQERTSVLLLCRLCQLEQVNPSLHKYNRQFKSTTNGKMLTVNFVGFNVWKFTWMSERLLAECVRRSGASACRPADRSAHVQL